VSVQIGSFELGQRPLLIAELGNNHEGDAGVARELVHAAADAGADAVKLQTFRVDEFVRPSDEARYRQLARFELSADEVQALAALAHELGLLFVSTALDFSSVALLEPLVDAYKVASGDNDFVALLDRLADTHHPLIVSTGLLGLDEIRALKERIEAHRAARADDPRLAFLHAVTAYPCPPEQVNLRAIPTLARELGCPVGYSDHTLGIDACVLAATLGAAILEKHVTLAHDFSSFRDHQLSATPDELRQLVAALESTQVLLGSAVKEPQPAEEELRTAVRRAIVAARDLAAGTVVADADLTWMRPRDGLAPGQEAVLVGRRLERAVARGEAIREEHLA
jgi:N,N'-diacetyllegionaminate synthase